MTSTDNNKFRSTFKRFRRMNPAEALKQALEPCPLNMDNFRSLRLHPICAEHLQRLSLNPCMDQWQAFELLLRPGFILIRGAMTAEGQYRWAKLCLIDWLHLPHKSNTAGDWPVDPMAAKSKVRWITYGYHHNWDTKAYADAEKSTLPAEMVELGRTIAFSIGYADYTPEASIVNYYELKSSMSGHVDRSERNQEAPLISVSIGQPCVFLIGHHTVHEDPVAVALRGGDICVMTGQSRLAYHGVPRVVSDQRFDQASSDDQRILHYLNEHRINFNIRQVD